MPSSTSTTPAIDRYEELTAVRLVGDVNRAVIRKEPRFEGDQQVAIVHYLELNTNEEEPNVN